VAYEQNHKLIVDIRADKRTPWDFVIAVFDACLRNHITQFSAKTAPAEIK
jgi:biopolymer transport protein ExbD